MGNIACCVEDDGANAIAFPPPSPVADGVASRASTARLGNPDSQAHAAPPPDSGSIFCSARDDTQRAHDASSDSESVRVWLDQEVKAGYGAKYASAFEEMGIHDKSDLLRMDDEIMAELEHELKSAGAKMLQLKDIKGAVEAVVGIRTKLAAALTNERRTSMSPRSSSKPFAAFVSHHKLACAMEARFLANELESILGAKVFLDSDDLKDLRMLGKHVVDSDTLVILQSSEVLLRPW